MLIGIADPIISSQQTRFLQDFTENIEHHVKMWLEKSNNAYCNITEVIYKKFVF